jgi:hypothetical protein
MPPTPFGACGLQAIGQTSGTVTAGLISVRLRLSVSPNTGAPGTVLTVAGFGFAAGETVSVDWSNPQTVLGTATANKSGSFSAQFAIPAGAATGTRADAWSSAFWRAGNLARSRLSAGSSASVARLPSTLVPTHGFSRSRCVAAGPPRYALRCFFQAFLAQLTFEH